MNLPLIWFLCSILNTYNVFDNVKRSGNREMMIPAILIGILFAPIISILGFIIAFIIVYKGEKK